VKTGTAHILAISGMHIGVIAAIFMFTFKMLPMDRRFRLGMTAILLIGYALMTGGRPSVIRATIMAVVLLGGYMFERESDSINLLGLAAFILLLMNPFYLFDVGFQLSFVCVGAIFMSMGGWKKRSVTDNNRLLKWKRALWDSSRISAAVWVGVAGLDHVGPFVRGLVFAPLREEGDAEGDARRDVSGFFSFDALVFEDGLV